MITTCKVSTPSRICLFGEHQDYLGLEVIACAINLRFSAEISPRDDKKIVIRIRDSKIDTLGMENTLEEYEERVIDLTAPITYDKSRDYLKSSVNVLLRNGYELDGCNIKMDSEIPIGKGMCSSSTMIVALIKALLSGNNHPDAEDPERIAYLAFLAEVKEFDEPGGMMDHYASALGGLVNLNFETGDAEPHAIESAIDGVFILFDSRDQKNTTKVLADAKAPTIEGLEQIGLTVRDCIKIDNLDEKVSGLTEKRRKAVLANVSNYKILLEAKEMFKSGNVEPEKLGKLIYAHHCNLRDGLGVSTAKIDNIIETAMQNGALGGKVNGSGGGGCGYVYCLSDDADKVKASIEALGYPAKVLKQDSGVRRDK